jgi:hypothetical protein
MHGLCSGYEVLPAMRKISRPRPGSLLSIPQRNSSPRPTPKWGSFLWTNHCSCPGRRPLSLRPARGPGTAPQMPTREEEGAGGWAGSTICFVGGLDGCAQEGSEGCVGQSTGKRCLQGTTLDSCTCNSIVFGRLTTHAQQAPLKTNTIKTMAVDLARGSGFAKPCSLRSQPYLSRLTRMLYYDRVALQRGYGKPGDG